MTKAREEEIRKECEAGLHCSTAEYLIKQEKRSERFNDKRAATAAAKATKAAMATICDENASLKEELQKLKQLNAQVMREAEELSESLEAEKARSKKLYENGMTLRDTVTKLADEKKNMSREIGELRKGIDAKAALANVPALDDEDVKRAARKQKFWKVLAKYVYLMHISKRMACMMAESAGDIDKKLLFKEPACGVSNADLTRAQALVDRLGLIRKFREIFAPEIANDERYLHDWGKMEEDTKKEMLMYFPQWATQIV